MPELNKITIFSPGKLIFGIGSLSNFLQDFLELGYKSLFIITIKPMLALLEKEVDQLKRSGISLKINTEITEEPTLEEFETILQQARSFNADSIVSIGGGSVMDTGKLVAAQLRNSQKIGEVLGIGNLKERKTYLACIPTTSGTGSEVSPNAIFVNHRGAKVGVISPFLVPDAAYVDPSLTITVPPSITSATGIDALAHCLEAYTNKFTQPMIDLIALEGVRLIGTYLERAYKDGKDLEARSQVALGSLYGGMCLGPVNTTAVHALAYPLGMEFHIPHGLSIAILLPYVMEFNLLAEPKRFADLALALGAIPGKSLKETAEASVHCIRDLIQRCGLPSTLAELGVPVDSIDRMATGAMEIERLLKNNIRKVELNDARNIYMAAFNGYSL